MNQAPTLNRSRLLELFMNLRQLVVPLFSKTMNDEVDGFAATSSWFLQRLVIKLSYPECVCFPRVSRLPPIRDDLTFQCFRVELFTISKLYLGR